MSNNTHVIDREALRRDGWQVTTHHPDAVTAAEKATTLFEQFHGFETSQEVADAIAAIVSDAITAARPASGGEGTP